MSLSTVNTLSAKTADFSIEETLAFLADEYQEKVVFMLNADRNLALFTASILKFNRLVALCTRCKKNEKLRDLLIKFYALSVHSNL